MKTATIDNREWVVVSEDSIETVNATRPRLLAKEREAGIEAYVFVRRPKGKKTYLAQRWTNGAYRWFL